MPEFILVLGKDEIDKRVSVVAEKISTDYWDHDLVLVGVLNGAFVFLSDLIRRISIPVKIDFLGASSYGSNTFSSGNIHLTKELEIDIREKDVLVIEDIVDTGLTLLHIIDYLKSFGPQTIKVCSLLDKRERRRADVKVDYACHVIQNGFCVGYGLDYAGDYRNLPDIYHLKL